MAPFGRRYTTAIAWIYCIYYTTMAFVTIALSCIISEIKRDIGRKSRFLPTPAFDVLARGSPSAYCHGTEKSEWYGYLANRQRKS